MQISKRIKAAQNIVEFVLIFPLLVGVTLVILEVALFWQDVNAVYNLNAEINSNLALLGTSGYSMGSKCPAAEKALEILEKKDNMVTINNPTYKEEILDGVEPFAYYKFSSTITIKNETNPQVTLWVDCRNPFEEGFMNQIEMYHKTLIIKASIPTIDGKVIEVIPEDIYIASPKESTLRHY